MRNPYYDGPPSDHFDGTRFFNPPGPASDKGLGDVLRWQLRETRARWPRQVPVTAVRPEERVTGLRVTMVGHSTLLIQGSGVSLLTDPVWAPRASPLSFAGPRRVTEPGIRFEDLPPIDAVLLSHNHYDHCDLATLKRLGAAHDPLFITPLGNDTLIRQAAPEARCFAGDWGDGTGLGGDVRVEIVPANHWSSRTTRDRRMALWSGFVLRLGGRTLYFAGDTGYCGGGIFADIRARYGPMDVALIPIGAYAPEWFMAEQHCNPEDAVRIMAALDAQRAIGIHWGTFQLTNEAREEPPERLAAELDRRGIPGERFVAGVPGVSYDF
ncbi:MBL fold metallo-hydrolase [Sphingomonas glaciei]|uniref:MBL fold metallo-hydrolase n=1 Tax=Sphingomonas glaciei TaxID=2938948 RepID=A0ABY5MXY2_9SPHN|nr:MBL fold metallo-hydrolase [Sphingomonas glaciei]UUR07216.1 MBL fold metallo-hydrolase [Sphingomonas glaciei]